LDALKSLPTFEDSKNSWRGWFCKMAKAAFCQTVAIPGRDVEVSNTDIPSGLQGFLRLPVGVFVELVA
jgi:hypothetical protein